MRRADSPEKTLMLGGIWGRRRRGWQDEMVGWHHWLDGHGFGWTLVIGVDREAWHATVHGVAKSQTRLSDWTDWSDGFSNIHKSKVCRTSMMVKWLRVCLPMQGTWARSLVQEDSTCCEGTELVCHNYWGHTLKQRRAPTCSNWRKPSHSNEDPARS